MWISRKDYMELKDKLDKSEEWRDRAESSRNLYSEKLDKVRAELDGLKRSTMPTNHYMVIDTKSGLRYDVDAVDYVRCDSYDDGYGFTFRKADYSMVLSIHKNISIQVVGEE